MNRGCYTIYFLLDPSQASRFTGTIRLIVNLLRVQRTEPQTRTSTFKLSNFQTFKLSNFQTFKLIPHLLHNLISTMLRKIINHFLDMGV